MLLAIEHRQCQIEMVFSIR